MWQVKSEKVRATTVYPAKFDTSLLEFSIFIYYSVLQFDMCIRHVELVSEEFVTFSVSFNDGKKYNPRCMYLY